MPMKKTRIPDLTPTSKRADLLAKRLPGGSTKPAPRPSGMKPHATSAKSGRRGQ